MWMDVFVLARYIILSAVYHIVEHKVPPSRAGLVYNDI